MPPKSTLARLQARATKQNPTPAPTNETQSVQVVQLDKLTQISYFSAQQVSAEQLCYEGGTLLSQKKYQEALDKLNQALVSFQKRPPNKTTDGYVEIKILKSLGDCYSEMHDIENAQKNYISIIKKTKVDAAQKHPIFSDYPTVREGTLGALKSLSKLHSTIPHDVIADFIELCALWNKNTHPDLKAYNAQAHEAVASLLSTNKDYDNALEHLRLALAKIEEGSKQSAKIHDAMGDIYCAQKNHANAVKEFAEVVKITLKLPKKAKPKSYIEIAQKYFDNGLYPNLLKIASKALETESTNNERKILMHKILSSSYEQLGHYTKAQKHLAEIIELHEQNIPDIEQINAQNLNGIHYNPEDAGQKAALDILAQYHIEGQVLALLAKDRTAAELHNKSAVFILSIHPHNVADQEAEKIVKKVEDVVPIKPTGLELNASRKKHSIFHEKTTKKFFHSEVSHSEEKIIRPKEEFLEFLKEEKLAIDEVMNLMEYLFLKLNKFIERSRTKGIDTLKVLKSQTIEYLKFSLFNDAHAKTEETLLADKFAMGKLAMASNNHEKAIACFEEALATETQAHRLGVIYAHLADMKEHKIAKAVLQHKEPISMKQMEEVIAEFTQYIEKLQKLPNQGSYFNYNILSIMHHLSMLHKYMHHAITNNIFTDYTFSENNEKAAALAISHHKKSSAYATDLLTRFTEGSNGVASSGFIAATYTIANLHLESKKFEEALQQLLHTKEMVDSIGTEQFRQLNAIIADRFFKIFWHFNMLDKAEENLLKALEVRKQLKGCTDLEANEQNDNNYFLSECYINLGKIYSQKKDHAKAVEYFSTGHSLSNSETHSDLFSNSLKLLADEYYSAKNCAEYIKYALQWLDFNQEFTEQIYKNEPLKTSREHVTKEKVLICHLCLAKSYELTGDYRNGLTHAETVIKYSDRDYETAYKAHVIAGSCNAANKLYDPTIAAYGKALICINLVTRSKNFPYSQLHEKEVMDTEQIDIGLNIAYAHKTQIPDGATADNEFYKKALKAYQNIESRYNGNKLFIPLKFYYNILDLYYRANDLDAAWNVVHKTMQDFPNTDMALDAISCYVRIRLQYAQNALTHSDTQTLDSLKLTGSNIADTLKRDTTNATKLAVQNFQDAFAMYQVHRELMENNANHLEDAAEASSSAQGYEQVVGYIQEERNVIEGSQYLPELHGW